MLMLSQQILESDVLSLHTGTKVATIKEAMINPRNLQVVGYFVNSPVQEGKDKLILKTNDIREANESHVIIDSVDELIPAKDLVKFEEIIKMNFKLIGIEVIDDTKTKLGKVAEYSLDPLTFLIHQLHVKRPLIKSLQISELLINRSQITKVTDKYITVSSASLKTGVENPLTEPGSFNNPFRKPQTETINIRPGR